MQLPSVAMSSNEGRQLQRRLDVRAETWAFEARPALLWAFQINKKQLQATFTQRPSLLHPTAAQVRAFGLQFGAKQRQSLVTCSHLSVTLATRFMCFGSECAVTHPVRQAACILSRRHEFPVLQLGAVAAAGAGFVCVIGSQGDGNGQFRSPYGGVAFDGEGNLVVSDGGNHRIQVFRYMDGAHLRTIGSRGAGIGQFNLPWGIAFDGAGHIIVCEADGNRVQVLRYSDGAHVCTFGSEGSGNGQLNNPSGIAVDGEGNIAVYDGGNHRVQVHRLSDGAYIRTIGSRGSGNGQFGEGGFGSYGGVAFDSEGNLVVADFNNHRVQVLRYSDGTHLRTIGSEGEGAGQFLCPSGVAFDAAGHIVVVELGNHRVQVLRYSDGTHLRTIGSCGSDNGQFNGPSGGIAIDSDGRIVEADTFNHRVQVLE